MIITEANLKQGLLKLTGQIEFKTVVRTNKKGIHLRNSSISEKISYLVYFEVELPKNKNFVCLCTNLGNKREFASLDSVIKFLKNIGFSFYKIKGEMTISKSEF